MPDVDLFAEIVEYGESKGYFPEETPGGQIILYMDTVIPSFMSIEPFRDGPEGRYYFLELKMPITPPVFSEVALERIGQLAMLAQGAVALGHFAIHEAEEGDYALVYTCAQLVPYSDEHVDEMIGSLVEYGKSVFTRMQPVFERVVRRGISRTDRMLALLELAVKAEHGQVC